MSRTEEPRFGRIAQIVDMDVLQRRRVTLLGQGSMGQPVGELLVRHGVGTVPPGRIRLVDGDVVESRNSIGTGFRASHVGHSKVEAAAKVLGEINPDVNVTHWNRCLEPADVPEIVKMASFSDLLVHAYDSFDLLPKIAHACNDICPQVAAFFGPRADFAEVAFSVPGITQSLSSTLGQRQLQSINKPQALGVDTIFITSFVAALCLRLLLGDAKGSELFPACYANAPLFIVNVRPSWIFQKQPQDLVRAVYCVGASPGRSD